MYQSIFFWLWVIFGGISLAALVYGFTRNVGNLYWRIVVCLFPIFLSGIIVAKAVSAYQAGEGGFRLGSDLAGGTKLVYEIDEDRKRPNFSKEELATQLKKRIDPADLYNIEISVTGDGVEIVLPTGSPRQTQRAEEAWRQVVQAVHDRYRDKLGDEDLQVNRGQSRDLMMLVHQRIQTRQWANVKDKLREKYGAKISESKDLNLDAISVGRTDELVSKLRSANIGAETELRAFVEALYQPEKFADVENTVNEIYPPTRKRRDLTADEVLEIREKIETIGSMEFLILANQLDDAEIVKKLQEEFPNIAADEFERRAKDGSPPPLPRPDSGLGWPTTREELGECTYRWVELGKQERRSLGLDNASEAGPPGSAWHQAAADRAAHRVTILNSMNQVVLFSRVCQNQRLSGAERERKKYEYFLLCREPEVIGGETQSITGQDLEMVYPTQDQKSDPAVGFTFNTRGGDRFYNVTSKNRPTQGFFRHLAIVLDDQIISAPRLNEAIRTQGQISGNFTVKDVDRMVGVLRSGALPAALNPNPIPDKVSASLGADTTQKGVFAVALSFLAVLIFMCIYYRFSGFVASVALLANLLLTIAFMVFVNATFTLQSMAGLVLMLGMAVDANVLIYERLREERDRGANLIVALRNAYDRAFPTILDTHLTSIFTAVILYVFGDSRLKGFGVSLFAGLVISLFTSLFMTRTIFDLWNRFNLLKKLGMFRFFSKPNFDFMRIRHYWFAATIILSMLGIGVFLWRGMDSLDNDFVGGTTFNGRLKSVTDIGQLRNLLSEDNQQKLLRIERVDEIDENERVYAITYAGSSRSFVRLRNRPPGATREQRERNIADRSSSVKFGTPLIHLRDDATPTASRYFGVSTREREEDLVLVTINRLFVDANGESLLQKVAVENTMIEESRVVFHFADYADRDVLKGPISRAALAAGIKDSRIVISGEDVSHEGRHKVMAVSRQSRGLSGLKDAEIKAIVEQAVNDYNERPAYDKIISKSPAMAADALRKALYAILASWAVILVYLWFRFGTWRFGAAAVLCLIHDLTFTIGIIAFCHYFVEWMPWLASILQITDFKIDLPAVAALLTLAGYSVNDTIVVFDRIREVRGKNPHLTPQMINDSVNQTLSRTLLASVTVWLVVAVLYWFGGEGVHLFSFVMVVGVVIGTYSSIYIASPLLLIFGEGTQKAGATRATASAVSPEGAAL